MRTKQLFQCQACGGLAPKWSGQCPECGGWNSLIETVAAERPAARPAGRICTLGSVDATPLERIVCGIGELDRVLGGGAVPGSVVLIGGDPGIGKSTLLLQLMAALAQGGCQGLYVSGEESPEQVAMRGRRIGTASAEVRLLTETRIEAVLEAVRLEAPQVLVVDSIQTLQSEGLASAPGSVAQVRECVGQLVQYAKGSGSAVFLVGHVTKEGMLAGPRVVEHLVDTVLYFEGEEGSRYRMVRATKNRFGAVHELGIFAMTEQGLREVPNPSAILLQRHASEVPGSVVTVTRQGTRPLLVEVQALVDRSHAPAPRRVAVGLDGQRLALLLAVLHRHGGIVSYDQDVFVNAVGGVRITETGADLAVALAVLSSLRGRPLSRELVVFGEVGLSGEIRPVSHGVERLREAAKHGFKRAIVPKANLRGVDLPHLDRSGVERLAEALEAC